MCLMFTLWGASPLGVISNVSPLGVISNASPLGVISNVSPLERLAVLRFLLRLMGAARG